MGKVLKELGNKKVRGGGEGGREGMEGGTDGDEGGVLKVCRLRHGI